MTVPADSTGWKTRAGKHRRGFAPCLWHFWLEESSSGRVWLRIPGSATPAGAGAAWFRSCAFTHRAQGLERDWPRGSGLSKGWLQGQIRALGGCTAGKSPLSLLPGPGVASETRWELQPLLTWHLPLQTHLMGAWGGHELLCPPWKRKAQLGKVPLDFACSREWPLPVTIPKTLLPLCTALLLLASLNFSFILFRLSSSRLAVIFTLEPGKANPCNGGSRLPQLSVGKA